MKTGSNIINQIRLNLAENADPSFIASYDKFVAAPDNLESLDACVRILRQQTYPKSGSGYSVDAGVKDEDIADCIYAYAASHNPYKKVKSSIKV